MFDKNALNVVVDNTIENYNKNLKSIEGDVDYKWFHVQNAYQKDNFIRQEDQNFYAFDSLTQLGNSKLFQELVFDTNHYKVHRLSKRNFPELKYWHNERKTDLKIKVDNCKIIHGKKVGRTLGIPTGKLNSQLGNS